MIALIATQIFIAASAASCVVFKAEFIMPIAGPAHCADKNCECEAAPTRPRRPGLASFTPRILTVSVVGCALALGGCARNSAQRETDPVQREARAVPVRVHRHLEPRQYSEPRQYTEYRVRQTDPALLTPQPAPDCELKKTDVSSVDPEEWARLKIDFERKCYQDAEKAARDRWRL